MPPRRSARINEPYHPEGELCLPASFDPTWPARRREILLALPSESSSSGEEHADTPENDEEHATEDGIEHAAEEDDELGHPPGEPENPSQEHVISQLVQAIFADVTRAAEEQEHHIDHGDYQSGPSKPRPSVAPADGAVSHSASTSLPYKVGRAAASRACMSVLD